MAQISKLQALQRTKKMLAREWNLSEEPTSDMNLKKAPPNGLGKNDNQIKALERPIKINDFKDVGAQVVGSDLITAKSVGDLRDVIWSGIDESNQTKQI